MARRRPTRPKDVMRTAFYSMWGVLTLVLLFAVTFLFVRLAQRERDLQTVAPLITNSVTVRNDLATSDMPNVRLYFAHPSELRLMGEDRPLPLTDSTRANCRAALNALIEGPVSGSAPSLPPVAQVRALYLLDSGELILDFSRTIDVPEMQSAGAEWLMVQSLAHTLTQPGLQGKNDRPVTTIRVLYEGSPAAQGSFPGHVLLAGPVRPDARLLGS
jgi:hypothetical protein